MPGTLPLKGIVALLAISAGCILADTVIVESKLSIAQVTPDPPYKETAGTWSSTSFKSTAAGCTPGVGSRYTGSANGAFRVAPTLGAMGDTYFMDITFTTLESASIVVGVSAVG